MPLDLFTPIAATVNIAATTSTARVALADGTSSGRSVRICNDGLVTVFIAFGNSAIEATAAAGIPIKPGMVEAMEFGKGVTHVAAITAAGSATIYFTVGQGA